MVRKYIWFFFPSEASNLQIKLLVKGLGVGTGCHKVILCLAARPFVQMCLLNKNSIYWTNMANLHLFLCTHHKQSFYWFFFRFFFISPFLPPSVLPCFLLFSFPKSSLPPSASLCLVAVLPYYITLWHPGTKGKIYRFAQIFESFMCA